MSEIVPALTIVVGVSLVWLIASAEAQIPPSDLTAAMPNRLVLGWLIASIGIGVLQGGHVAHAQPTFRTGVDLVSVTAVVSDKGGRPVRELTRDDFQVFDDGERRPVLEFWADDSAALSLALLFDVSGSMHVGSKMADARSTANILLARPRHGTDEAAEGRGRPVAALSG